jgi:hypothetical protein
MSDTTIERLLYDQIDMLRERNKELRAAMLAVILAYDDNDDAPDPEKALSDAIQAARAVWPEQ